MTPAAQWTASCPFCVSGVPVKLKVVTRAIARYRGICRCGRLVELAVDVKPRAAEP